MAKTAEFEGALMHRDGMTKSEAKKERQRAREMFNEIIESGGSYDEVEDMMCSEFGLEMDYIFDIM